MSKRVNRDDVDKFHDYSLYIPKRLIYMGSEAYDMDGGSGTDGAMAERFIKNLRILEGINSDSITVIMNNYGGHYYDGLAIYDAIASSSSHITIQVFGSAMSMGSIILQAADLRIMAPNARQMIHYGSNTVSDHGKTVVAWAKEDEKTHAWMETLYWGKIKEKHPEFPLSKVKKMLNFDTILTTEESIDLGLADESLDEERQ